MPANTFPWWTALMTEFPPVPWSIAATGCEFARITTLKAEEPFWRWDALPRPGDETRTGIHPRGYRPIITDFGAAT